MEFWNKDKKSWKSHGNWPIGPTFCKLAKLCYDWSKPELVMEFCHWVMEKSWNFVMKISWQPCKIHFLYMYICQHCKGKLHIYIARNGCPELGHSNYYLCFALPWLIGFGLILQQKMIWYLHFSLDFTLMQTNRKKIRLKREFFLICLMKNCLSASWQIA